MSVRRDPKYQSRHRASSTRATRPAWRRRRSRRAPERAASGDDDASSRASDQAADALFELRERRRRPAPIAANDRNRSHTGQYGWRRHQPLLTARRHSKHALTQSHDERKAGTAGAEEDDEALPDGELRCTDRDAAEPAQPAAGNAELQRRTERTLQ